MIGCTFDARTNEREFCTSRMYTGGEGARESDEEPMRFVPKGVRNEMDASFMYIQIIDE